MGTGQVGPAYQSEESEGRRGGGERKVAALRRELEELRSRMDNLPTELVVRGEGAQMEWRSAVEKVEARVIRVEELVESNSQRVERAVEMCTAKAEEEEGLTSSSSSSSATVMGIREELRRVEAKMEEREQEARKYFLLITKLRRTRRLIKLALNLSQSPLS